jgi:DNA polymerase-3 subunit delta
MAEAPTYLFCGPDTGEKRRSIERLRTQLQRSSGGAPLAIERHYPFDTVMVDVIASLRTPSLFAPRRLVVLSQAESLKAADVAALADYCREPAEGTTLVIETEELRVAKRLQDAVPASCRRVFWERFPDQRRRSISAFFSERGIAIDDQAVETLSEIVGSSSTALESECAALAAMHRASSGERGTLSVEDIDRWVHHSRAETVFTLFDHLGTRDLAAGIRTLQAIMLTRQTTPSQLLGGLASQFRKAADLQHLLPRMDSQQAWRVLKVSGKRAQASLARAAEGYRAAELQAILRVLAEFDLRIRSAAQHMQLNLLRLVLYYVVVRGGRGAWRLFPH